MSVRLNVVVSEDTDRRLRERLDELGGLWKGKVSRYVELALSESLPSEADEPTGDYTQRIRDEEAMAIANAAVREVRAELRSNS